MKPPAFQFYAADFLVGTVAMTNEEVGIYIRLLCHQWDRGFVAKDKAARLVGAEIPADVLAKFVETNGELRNQRLETERKKQTDFREQQSLRGKAGADARWNASRDGTRYASANGETMAPPSSGQWRNDGSPSSSSVFNSSSSLEWKEVEEELEKEGVGLVADTVERARKRGYTPEQVMLVIQHYRDNAGAWEAGGLVKRLTNSRPDKPLSQGWPKPSDKFVRDQQRAKEARQRAEDAAKRRADEEKRQADAEHHAAEIEQLESEFGSECDRLTDSNVSEIAKQNKSVAMQLTVARKAKASPLTSSPMLRVYLLRHLKAARSPPDATAPTKTDDSRQRVARSEITKTTPIAQGIVP